MIARTVLRIPVRSRLIRPAYHCQHDAVAELPFVLSLRTYASPGRPKSVVGEPSKPVKRAVKKAAAKPATGDTPAEKKVAANKRNAAKKATGNRKKKELTPEQKERAQQRETKRQERLAKEKAAKKTRATKLKARTKASSEKQQIKDLKATALKPPKVKRVTAYLAFVSEKSKDHDLSTGTNQERKERIARFSRDVSTQYKNMTPAELEHYNHLANSQKEASLAEYKKWVESHSADEIQRANSARAMLRRKLEKERPKRKASKWTPINDERAVKRPVNPYAQFVINRNASGDFKNIPLGERSKLIGQEWKTLSDQEKTKYNNLGTQETERYATEYKDVYGHDLPQAAAAAA